jgi:hypothetical protein
VDLSRLKDSVGGTPTDATGTVSPKTRLILHLAFIIYHFAFPSAAPPDLGIVK